MGAGETAEEDRNRQRRGIGLLWILLWATAAATIAFPALTTFVARALGIGRGADALLYFTTLTMFFGFFCILLRLRRIAAEITTLVRATAILDARMHDALRDGAARADDPQARPARDGTMQGGAANTGDQGVYSGGGPSQEVVSPGAGDANTREGSRC